MDCISANGIKLDGSYFVILITQNLYIDTDIFRQIKLNFTGLVFFKFRAGIDKNLKLSEHLHLFNSESETIIFNEMKSDNTSENNYIKIDFSSLINNILIELYKQNIVSVDILTCLILIQQTFDVQYMYYLKM